MSFAKLTIRAFTDPARHTDAGIFTAMFNPQSYQHKYQVNYAKTQGINTSGKAQSYSLTLPGELSFKLLLDGTANNLGTRASVIDEVQRLLDLCKNMNGSIHQPNYLVVSWGDLSFSCRLKDLDINYTLFNADGKPLRAELDIVFIEDIPDNKRLPQEHKQSPDLTHSRLIKAGDKLPGIAQQIYGNPAYYQALARFNDLNNCRTLSPGITLHCPPLKALMQAQLQPATKEQG